MQDHFIITVVTLSVVGLRIGLCIAFTSPEIMCIAKNNPPSTCYVQQHHQLSMLHFPYLHQSSLLQMTNNDKEGNNEYEEIFYDDFSGFVGEVVSQDLNDNSSNKIIEDELLGDLPDFDFDDDIDNSSNSNLRTEERELISIPLPQTVIPSQDLTGCTIREFSFGPDILLSSYTGSQGFDKVRVHVLPIAFDANQLCILLG